MGELIFLFCCGLSFGAYVLLTQELSRESTLFPYAVQGFAALFLIYLVVDVARKKPFAAQMKKKSQGNRSTTFKIALVVVLSIVSVLFWETVGFTLSTLLFLGFSMALLGVSLRRAIVLSVLIALVYNLTFVNLLHISIPDFLRFIY